MAARTSENALILKLLGRHKARLEEISAAHGGVPPVVVIAAGLHALAELTKHEQVRVMVACVEGESPRRKRRRRASAKA